MYRTTYAVLALALAAFSHPVAAIPLLARDPQQSNPNGPTTPGINIPGINGGPGFQLGPGGLNYGTPGGGSGGVSLGPGGLQITPGNGQPPISIGTGNPSQQPGQPAPKPPRRVLDDQDLGGDDD
ncbi:hypothetical protein PpBr36_05488 [Pyricularia pennisetigena]|uniref:hypothetical protein n=1 Tax=Pyricularia pennisetigena TaxID=1578925 RepID=UPI0011513B90|nr:hypothetical protein PpBr36_05488 [Pyricularia pennisetigena]TLS27365.1 hypothetical protein PpBr36_05488 [Pyricularia pennisetigena]